MTRSQKNTGWTIVFLIVCAIAAVWILPKLLAALRGGSGSSSGVGASPLSSLLPKALQPNSSGGGGVLGGGGGGGSAPASAASGLSGALSSWIQGVLNQGWANAAQLPIDSSYIPGLGVSPDLSIPYESYNWEGYSPDDFLVTQDIPGYNYDSSGDLSVDDTDLSDYEIPYEQTQLYDFGDDYSNVSTGDYASEGDISGY